MRTRAGRDASSDTNKANSRRGQQKRGAMDMAAADEVEVEVTTRAGSSRTSSRRSPSDCCEGGKRCTRELRALGLADGGLMVG